MSTDINHYYLQQMGIQIWIERSDPVTLGKLHQLKQTVSNCMNCPRHKTRSHAVFAKGNPLAKLMVIGDTPSHDDEQEGVPFTGKAGSLLRQMLSSIGLSEQDVYITNVLKCKTSENTAPTAEEISQCEHHLLRQIALVKPDLLLTLGDISRETVVKNNLNVPFVASYHPDQLLQHPANKKQAFADLMAVRKMLSEHL